MLPRMNITNLFPSRPKESQSSYEVGPEKKAKYLKKNYQKKHILTDLEPKKLQKKVHLD